MQQRIERQEWVKAILPTAITAAVLLVIFAWKQIFPFGKNTIDYYDMGQLEGAFYYHTWDFMHGCKSPFYDWYSGLGVNMTATSTVYNIFSVFNLFFLFIKRNQVFECLSVLTLLRIALCALTMYLFLKEESGGDYTNQVVFSVLYALSGYCLQYYVLSSFLEIAIFFPLLFLFFLRLLRGESFLPYVTMLTLNMMTCYYLGFMILLFLLMAAGIYCLLFVGKNDRKRVIARLGLSTLLSLLLSSCLLVPQLVQTVSSSRFTNDAGGIAQYLKILRNEYGSYTIRWWHLLNMTPAVAVILAGCMRRLRQKEGRRQMAFLLGMISLIGICLVSESVNLMLHFGSYVQFPLRNGFLLCFSLCLSGAVFSKDFEWRSEGAGAGGALKVMLSAAGAASVSLFLLNRYFDAQIWKFKKIFHLSVFFCGILFLCYLLLILIRKRYAVHSLFLILIAAEVFMTSAVLIGKPHYKTGYSEEPEQDGSYVKKTMQLMEELPIEPGTIDRIKNSDTTLNANYPFVMKRAALSNWTHLIGKNLQHGVGRLGYSSQFTRLLDSGGTVFSDALFHVTQAVSCTEQETALYDLKSDALGYRLYDCKFVLPFGVAVSEEVKELTLKKQNFIFLQNELYHVLTGEDNLITSVLEQEKWEVPEDGKLTFTVPVNGNGILYFKANNGTEQEDYLTITANEKEIPIPTVSRPKHRKYPAHFNNGLLNLGIYKDENVQVVVEGLKEREEGRKLRIRMGVLDLDKLEKLCNAYADKDTGASASGRHLSLIVEGSEEKNTLLLPVAYDKGFRVYVNGRRQEASEVSGAFMAVPLENGKNEVELTFLPGGFEAGIFLTLAGILFFIAVIFLRKKYALGIPKIVQQAAALCFWAAFSGIAVFMYAIPAASNLLGFVMKIAK